MTFDEAVLAAPGYRRSGMSWEWIGKHTGHPKDKLRKVLTEMGLADGWGDSPILLDGWCDGGGKHAGGAPAVASSKQDR